MNLYSKLEKHLPVVDNSQIYPYKKGFNFCKAQYDEVLRRVVVDIDEESVLAKALEIGFMVSTQYGQQEPKLMPVSDKETLIRFAKAIANSPDVIKVATHKTEQGG